MIVSGLFCLSSCVLRILVRAVRRCAVRLSNGQRKNRKLLQPWMHHEAAPNTTKFANALHAIYAAWAIVAGALLAGRSAPQRRARARALLSAQGRAAGWPVDAPPRVRPYRNGVVFSHMARALDGSGWLAFRQARLAAGKAGKAGTWTSAAAWVTPRASCAASSAPTPTSPSSTSTAPSAGWAARRRASCTTARRLPFGDGSFDLAVCGQVLHHIPDNARSVSEVCRVATHVLVVEDLVRRGTAQEAFCHFWDSLWNWDFFQGAGTPHTNREHEEWLRLFEEDCAMELRHFHATSLAFKKDVVADDPAQFKALANGFYVIAQKHK